jgi:hypothetical protein
VLFDPVMTSYSSSRKHLGDPQHTPLGSITSMEQIIENPSCLGIRAVVNKANMLKCVFCGFAKVNSISRRISHITEGLDTVNLISCAWSMSRHYEALTRNCEGLTRIHKLGIQRCSLRRHMAFCIKVANNESRAYWIKGFVVSSEVHSVIQDPCCIDWSTIRYWYTC